MENSITYDEVNGIFLLTPTAFFSLDRPSAETEVFPVMSGNGEITGKIPAWWGNLAVIIGKLPEKFRKEEGGGYDLGDKDYFA